MPFSWDDIFNKPYISFLRAKAAWRVFYSDANGLVTELAPGADGTVLTSTGTTSAPAFEAIPAQDHGALSGLGDDDHTQYATNTELTAHIDDTTAAHAASAIANTPAGSIAATTVQAAIDELDSEKSATGHTHTGQKIFMLMRPSATTEAAFGDYVIITMADGVQDGGTVSGFFPYTPSAVKVIVACDTASGDMAWFTTTSFGAVGESHLNHTDGQGSAATPQVTALTQDIFTAIDITDSFTGAVAGDFFGLLFLRDGGDALDTMSAAVQLFGLLIEP